MHSFGITQPNDILANLGIPQIDGKRFLERDFSLGRVANDEAYYVTYQAFRQINNNIRNMYINLSANNTIDNTCAEALINTNYDTVMTAEEALKFGLKDCAIENEKVKFRVTDKNQWQQVCAIQGITPN